MFSSYACWGLAGPLNGCMAADTVQFTIGLIDGLEVKAIIA
jgi:hypothetical protein